VPCVPIDPSQQRDNYFSVSQNTFNISPNPGNGIFEITSLPGFLEIFNSTGVLIYSDEIKNNKTTFDISQFADGMYFVKLKTSKSLNFHKIILNRQ